VTRGEEVVRHPLSIAGVLITTSTAVLFIALLIAVLAGLLDNPYAGLVIFVAIPALFVSGLLLIPAGAWLQRRKREQSGVVPEWPVLDFRRPKVRRNVLVFTALTAANAVIVLLAGYGSLHWMESPSFCGQVCHTPMHPQFTAWRANGSHPGVACVSCHIGEGARGFVHAKAAGVRQLAHVVTDSYPRPIPAGAHLAPEAQANACRTCHKSERVGDRISVTREYADDEANSETMTVLELHVGAGSESGRAIHWHANPAVRIEYIATDAGRATIPYVKVTDANGRTKEYRTEETTDELARTTPLRLMTCVDCHNTVGHPIAPSPERAVDRAIAAGQISRALPFVRRESVRALTGPYGDEEDAEAAIDRRLRELYASGGGPIDQQSLERTIAAVRSLYRRNVFPAMKVTWGSYPDHRSHIDTPGCVRCHDDSHLASDGSTISGDCEYCHKQIER
jgi:hypothetical protein